LKLNQKDPEYPVQRRQTPVWLPKLFLLSLVTVQALTILPVQAQSDPAGVTQGYGQLGQGLVQQAIATFKQAVQQYPGSVRAKLGLAIAYQRQGLTDDAWKAYQAVLAQDSRNLDALKAVGELGGFRPQWQAQGIVALTTALSVDGNDRVARAQRALLYGYQGRFPESIGDYEILLNGANPSPEVILGAARIYTYNSDPAKGLELFNRYRSISPKPIDGNNATAYARALRETGNPAQAIALLEPILPKQLNPDAMAIRSELAQDYLAVGQPALALGILDPLKGRSDARLPLARALNEIGKTIARPDLRTEAARLYLEALQSETSPQVSLVREIADVLSGTPGQQAIGLQLYRQLVQQDPNNRGLVIRQLVLENKLGQLPLNILQQRLQALLQVFPREPAEQQSIAQALSPLDPLPELMPVYQALLQAGVNEPFLHFRLAQLLIEQNDLINAQTELRVYTSTPAGAKDFAPMLLLAEIDRRQNNLEGAAQRYQGLLAQPNLDNDIAMGAAQGLAGIRLAQSRPTEALALYDQLLQRNPADWQLRLGRTAIAYQADLISEAAADGVLVQFVQSGNPETPKEFYNLVTLLPASPQREPLYVALLQADPNNIDIQVRLIQVLSKRDPMQAQAQANRLMVQAQRMAQANPNASTQTLFLRGRLAAALGNLEQAGNAYQAILGLQPDNLEVVAALGGIRFEQRRFDAATQLYAYVLAFQPDNGPAQKTLAELTAAQDKPLEALERFQYIKVQQGATGIADGGTNRRILQLQEEFLQRRGFQPPWERY
jgi:cellulose synthase operon protein C